MAEKEVIQKNFEEYWEIAEYSMSKGKYNAAVILYYKALVEICDRELLKAVHKIGANHTERFALLEKNAPELYGIASRLFRFYRDSYNKEITETVAKLVKNEVEHAQRISTTVQKN
ncbi:MAG: hypothetical protein Q7R76_06610 [Candidatus Woesearchaeota archaeon]|nr:hypothetical protein [Candidatus Woesearchaeota archaeon]